MSKLLTLKQVAEWLGVTELTIRRWTYEGHIPRDCYFKLAGTLRFDADKLQALIESLKSTETEECDAERDECDATV